MRAEHRCAGANRLCGHARYRCGRRVNA
jgi:hypothetical protein